MRGFSWVIAASLALGLACEAGGDPPPELGVRVQWLTPSAALPSDLTQLNLKLFTDASGDFEDTGVSVASLEERDGRRLLAHPLLRDLPTGVPVRLVVEGLAGAELKYLGVVGPLVLSAGERRYVDLAMYQLGRSSEVSARGLTGRFMHTGTLLPDGRALIAGGFDRVESMVVCPPGFPAETRCFSLRASRDAFVFDATTGTFHRVRGAMLQARAGHSATLLPGGRVLLAGGAAEALLAMMPLGDPASPRGYGPVMVPLAGGALGAHASFEVFVPNANAEAEDLDRDGDPARGGFTGAADAAAMPGRLSQERFLHASAGVPGQPSRVLLAGGVGSVDATGVGTWEIYDDDKAGGYGVYDNSRNALSTPRNAPSAVTLGVPEPGRIWIFGGAVAFGNEDLAEIWEPVEGDPNGVVRRATETPFPNTVAGDETPRPEYAMLRPQVASFANGTYALVVGWLGPRCLPGESTPVFPAAPDASDTELCGAGGGDRDFVVDGATGVTRPQVVARPHAFGAIAQLTDGSVAVTGGVSNIAWMREGAIETFTGALAGGTAAAGDRATLSTPRALHTTTPLPQAGMVTVGGLALSVDARNASLVAAPEVLYPQRAPLSRSSTGGDAGIAGAGAGP